MVRIVRRSWKKLERGRGGSVSSLWVVGRGVGDGDRLGRGVGGREERRRELYEEADDPGLNDGEVGGEDGEP